MDITYKGYKMYTIDIMDNGTFVGSYGKYGECWVAKSYTLDTLISTFMYQIDNHCHKKEGDMF